MAHILVTATIETTVHKRGSVNIVDKILLKEIDTYTAKTSNHSRMSRRQTINSVINAASISRQSYGEEKTDRKTLEVSPQWNTTSSL